MYLTSYWLYVVGDFLLVVDAIINCRLVVAAHVDSFFLAALMACVVERTVGTTKLPVATLICSVCAVSRHHCYCCLLLFVCARMMGR